MNIEADKAELQKRREQARARLEKTRREAEAKMAVLKEQTASANAEHKQQLEQRLAEVQEDLKTRTENLRRALEHTREAPGTEPDVDDAATAGLPPIERVYQGMTVVDADGKEIGKVALVRIGDPEAASLDGEWRGEVSIAGTVFVEAEPDLPRELRHSLLRMGFIKVDRSGILGIGDKKHYVGSDKIAGVSGDRVTLTVAEAQLPDSLNQDGPIRSY